MYGVVKLTCPASIQTIERPLLDSLQKSTKPIMLRIRHRIRLNGKEEAYPLSQSTPSSFMHRKLILASIASAMPTVSS